MNLKDKIYILDGAMGTMIQKHGAAEADNNSERLNLTRPDVIKKIHKEYIAAGADIIEYVERECESTPVFA